MITANQWNRVRRQQDALILNSTNAGQNRLHGTTRRIVTTGVSFPTQSNPRGLGTRLVITAPIANPLADIPSSLANVTSTKVNGGLRKLARSYSPTGKWAVTLGDAVRQAIASQGAL